MDATEGMSMVNISTYSCTYTQLPRSELSASENLCENKSDENSTAITITHEKKRQ